MVSNFGKKVKINWNMKTTPKIPINFLEAKFP